MTKLCIQNRLKSHQKRSQTLKTKKFPGEACSGPPYIQNKLIEISGDIRLSTICKQVRAANQFSVMADDAIDSANDEQLAIKLRHVKEFSQKIEERFLDFSECVAGITC